MKSKFLVVVSLCSAILMSCSESKTSSVSYSGLKDVVSGKFLIGAAINVNQSSGQDTSSIKLIKQHYNSIVAENCMKSEVIQPEEGKFNFSDADQFVKFGQENNMAIIGHCLIWHSQLPQWFCVDNKGNNVSPEVLKQRMKAHISTVVGRYKGKIKGWDVVNEAILDDGTYRKSKFYEILGEEFIPLAFQYAHEADPDAELYYNDFNMSYETRRATVVKLIKDLKARGLRIDAVGMQAHMGLNGPAVEDFEKSIVAFAEAGVKVMITEWDMTALPDVVNGANISDTTSYKKELDPYVAALPDSVSNIWNKRMEDFFHLYLKHSDVVSRVTFWGVSDGDSWRNYWPIPGRHDYALPFGRDYQPKAFVKKLINDYRSTKQN